MTRLLLPSGLALLAAAYLWLQRRDEYAVWREHCRSREETGTELDVDWQRRAA